MDTSIRKLIDLPDYVTLLGGAAASLAMLAAIEQRFSIAALLMLLSVLCDFIDGKVARAIKRKNTEFGSALDAVTDIVSFGATPMIFGYCLGMNSPLSVTVLLLFAGTAALRLARFLAIPYSSRTFTGMPVTYNNIFIPLTYFGLQVFSLENHIILLFLLLYLCLSALMISSIRWIKF